VQIVRSRFFGFRFPLQEDPDGPLFAESLLGRGHGSRPGDGDRRDGAREYDGITDRHDDECVARNPDFGFRASGGLASFFGIHLGPQNVFARRRTMQPLAAKRLTSQQPAGSTMRRSK
jgi:hypothetical protein